MQLTLKRRKLGRGSAKFRTKFETLRKEIKADIRKQHEWFGCCICLGPKLNMVSGQCQHRICDECLYDKEEKRRPCMTNCPICCLDDSFPQKRPVLPAQVIDTQRCLGIQECPNKCDAQMWYWEVEDHLKCCPNSVKSPSPKKNETTVTKRKRGRVSDLGVVSVTRRCSQRHKKDYTSVLRPRTSS